MKRLLLTVLCCFMLASAFEAAAQRLLVVYTKNNYKVDNKGKKTPLSNYDEVDKNDVVLFPSGGKMILLDREHRQLFEVKAGGKVRLNTVLPKNTSGLKALSEQYFNFIMKSVAKKRSFANKHGGLPRVAASYRGQVSTDTLVLHTFVVPEEEE